VVYLIIKAVIFGSFMEIMSMLLIGKMMDMKFTKINMRNYNKD